MTETRRCTGPSLPRHRLLAAGADLRLLARAGKRPREVLFREGHLLQLPHLVCVRGRRARGQPNAARSAAARPSVPGTRATRRVCNTRQRRAPPLKRATWASLGRVISMSGSKLMSTAGTMAKCPPNGTSRPVPPCSPMPQPNATNGDSFRFSVGRGKREVSPFRHSGPAMRKAFRLIGSIRAVSARLPLASQRNPRCQTGTDGWHLSPQAIQFRDVLRADAAAPADDVGAELAPLQGESGIGRRREVGADVG